MAIPALSGLLRPTATTYSSNAIHSASHSKSADAGNSTNSSAAEIRIASSSPRRKFCAASSGRGKVAISEHITPTSSRLLRAPFQALVIHSQAAQDKATKARTAFIEASAQSRCSACAWPRR